jgi:predicted amino acid-binding ACT domain protein
MGPKVAFLIQGDDRVGAVAEVLSKLGQAQINVTAMQVIASGEGRYGAILWVEPRNIGKAAQALGVA